MRCPHCGGYVSDYSKRDYDARKAEHVCADCPADLSMADIRAGHVRCVACRAKRNARRRQTYRGVASAHVIIPTVREKVA